jgi:uncharacterized protein YfaS (alpha-2-macroglobulin family)
MTEVVAMFKLFKGRTGTLQLVALLVLCTVLVCAGAAMGVGEKDFIVKVFSPKGLVTGRTQIKAVFNRAAVSGDIVGKEVPASKIPFVFSPQIEGTGRWESDSVFVFHPKAGVLAQATSYTATARDELRDLEGRLLSGAQSFSFRTPALNFLGAEQTDFDVNTGAVIYQLNFSLPVSPVRLLGYLSVKDRNNRPVKFNITQGPVSKAVLIAMEPSDGGDVTLAVEAGMPSEAGPLGLEKTKKVKLSRVLDMEISGSYASSGMRGGTVSVQTTAPVDFGKVSSFVEVSPKVPYTIEPDSRGFVIAGNFKPFDRITVKLKKGLPSLSGKSLAKDWSRAFIFPNRGANVEFDAPGRVISPAGSLRVPIETVNIEKLKVTAHKLYENNIPIGMRSEWASYPLDLSKLMAEKTYTVQGKPNETVRRALDLKSIIGDEKGVFLLIAEKGDAYDSGSYAYPSRLVVNVTDLGMTVKTGPDSALAWVNSIKTGEPVRGAKVALWSWANQKVAEGETNSKGIAELDLKDVPSDTSPVIATVSKEGDVSFVRLTTGLYQGNDEIETDGAGWVFNGYSAYCYLPRDIFRPGDTVPIRGIVRGTDGKAPKSFPVTVKILTPEGKLWAEKTAKLSNEGTFATDLKTPLDAQTGVWFIQVMAPGQDGNIGYKDFYIEEFAPPRLFVDAETTPKKLIGDMSARLAISSRYTFGGSASGLQWEATMEIAEKLFRPSGWNAYVFADVETEFSPESTFLGSGNLDKKGAAYQQIKGRTWTVPSMGELRVRSGVMEEGGRWVYKTQKIDWFPTSVMLGISVPDSVAPGKSAEIRVAAVDTDGKAATSKEVSYKLFRRTRQYVTYEMDGRTMSRTHIDLLPRGEGSAEVKDGVANISLEFKEAGEYLIRVEDMASGAKASAFIYAYGYGNEGESGIRPDIASVTMDKKLYKSGETVKAKVKAPFAGKLLYSVETYKSVQNGIIDMKGKDEAEISFKAADTMMPNAWLTVQIIKPASGKKENVRAYGAAPVMIDNSVSKLSVEIADMGRLKPGENKFSLTVKDHRGKGAEAEVTVMLVDEMVLGLTGWKRPDAFGYFSGKKRLGMETYDLYNALIAPEDANTALLTPGGGAPDEFAAMERANSLSPVKTRRFKVLSLIKTVKSDRSGKCDFTFVIPEFAGTARLTAVAVKTDATGSGEGRTVIARDIVTEPALPRALAPNDKFTAPVQLFNMSEKPLHVKLAVKTSGPVKLLDRSEAEFDIKNGANTSRLLTFKGTGAGVAEVEFLTEWEGGSSKTKIEMPVRPATPRVSEGKSYVVDEGGTQKVPIEGDWFPGTRRGRIMLSAMPSLSLADAAKFLVDYPYGCFEQTVSAAWPLMLQPALIGQIDPELADEKAVSGALNKRITAIRAMQTYDGGFSKWPGQSWSQPWESLYGTHFLVEAGKSGVAIPEDNVKAALAYTRRLLSAAPTTSSENAWKETLTRRAYACYVLALSGENQLGWIASLRDREKELTPSGRMLLAAACAVVGQKDDARKMAGDTFESLRYTRGKNLNYDSPLRDRALHLLALTHIDPAGAPAAAAANNLLEALRADKHTTTQENGFAMLALARWFQAQPSEGDPAGAILDASGNKLVELNADKRMVFADLKDGEEYNFENSGKSRLYGAWTVSGIPVEAVKPRDEGIEMRATMLNSENGVIKDKVKQGEAVFYVATVAPKGRLLRDVVISLPLPAGLENETVLGDDRDRSFNQSGRVEVRDDRLIIFVDEMAEAMKWTFKLRAVTAGEFTVPQYSAECMYNPAINSVNGGGRLTITKP